MHVVHITSELTPIAKVGGLGDVVFGLCNALCHLGHDAKVILPKYDCLDLTKLKNLKILKENFKIEEGGAEIHNTIWEANLDRVKIYLIEDHHPKQYFKRGTIYCCPDDTSRFLYFCKVATSFLKSYSHKIDLIHIHDWPTAIISLLAKEYKIAPSVYTIHNLEHQGLIPPETLLTIPLKQPFPLDYYDLSQPHLINLMRIGLEYSNAITTVSPSYEKEIQTKEGGSGLSEVLKRKKEALKGILNGIDYAYYDPLNDPYLYHLFHKTSYQSPLKLYEDKNINKSALFQDFGKPVNDKFTLAAITRIAKQKAPELIAYSIEQTVALGGRFIMLGSLQGDTYQSLFADLKKRYENHPDVLIFLNKDDALAHKIYAASDALIIPSLFEPCGLTQMIAMRYGSVPLARKTGGLADTIFDIDTSDKALNERNGFTFDFADTGGIDWVLKRAMNKYSNSKVEWTQLAHRIFNIDNSWNQSAKNYEKLYASLSALLM